MRTLLTGAKGQLARCLRDRLPEDWELIATDSTSLDITDTEAVHHMIKNFQPDAIVNAAAYTAVDKAEENAEAAFAVNASAVHNLAAAARAAHARFIHISTDYVFDAEGKRPCLYMALVLTVTVGATTAFAAGDPLSVINNLSTFIFSLIRAIGLILLGFGVVQVGLSLKSHDPSQRANGFLTLAGGVIITFAKEILDLIMA